MLDVLGLGRDATFPSQLDEPRRLVGREQSDAREVFEEPGREDARSAADLEHVRHRAVPWQRGPHRVDDQVQRVHAGRPGPPDRAAGLEVALGGVLRADVLGLVHHGWVMLSTSSASSSCSSVSSPRST